MSEEAYKERMEFLNRVLALQDFFDRPVRTLSLGQRMRADLGAALLHNPKVLYLDEPTIGLDLVVKDNIRAAIKEINQKYHTTVILTTHDIEDVMKKKLQIYLPFASNELKRQMAYKGAFYLFLFISTFGSFISYFLWMAIYKSSPQNTLGGFTRNEMVT